MATSAELREMDDQELVDNLASAQETLFNLRFQHVTGQLDNYSRLREVRREIARVHTVMREREIAEAEQQQASSKESGDRGDG
jgi:large subunit ribosomal protein L29